MLLSEMFGVERDTEFGVIRLPCNFKIAKEVGSDRIPRWSVKIGVGEKQNGTCLQ